MIWLAAQHDDPARNRTARVIGALTGRTGRAQPRGAARPAGKQTRSAGTSGSGGAQGTIWANGGRPDHKTCMGGSGGPLLTGILTAGRDLAVVPDLRGIDSASAPP